MRSFFRREFETRFAYPLAGPLPRRGFAFYVADPLRSIHPPPHMRYGVAGEFTLMIKQVASWCVTVGSGPVCDERRAT
jgi:hypothetical protein